MKKIITLACALLCLGSQAQSLTTGLVICMPMDNTNLANDLSGNNNNGSLMGSPTLVTGRTGAATSAYAFNGTSQYIQIPTSTSIDQIEINDEISISVWCNVNSYPNNIFPMIEKDGNAVSWSFNILDPAAVGGGYTHLFYHGADLPTPATWNPMAYAGPAAVMGQWTHYGLTYSAATGFVKYYINGLPVVTLSNGNAALPNTNGNITLGFSGAAPPEYGDGALDELRVYNRVISDSDMFDLFNDPTLLCSSTSSTWTPPSTGCCLGNDCGQAVNALTTDYQISTAGNDFNFTDDALRADKVQVGVACGTQLAGKFNVFTNKYTDPGGAQTSISIFGLNNSANNNALNTGVHGKAVGVTSKSENRGVWGYGDGNEKAIGVYGEGWHGGCAATQAGGPGSYGGYFRAIDPNGGTNYGIYATGKNGQCGNFAAYFDGNVTVNGMGTITGGVWSVSDRRYKTGIRQMDDVSERLKKLNGYTYNFKTEEFAQKNFDKDEQIGFIAQELKELFPQSVKEDKDGYLIVNYQALIPVLVEGFKEQQSRIDALQQQLDQQQQLSTALSNPGGIANGYALSQNEPNPFSHETVIRYTVPKTASKAVINVYDLNGKQITSYPLTETGSSSLTITANQLSAGIYIYCIVADGKVIDSKRMIVQE